MNLMLCLQIVVSGLLYAWIQDQIISIDAIIINKQCSKMWLKSRNLLCGPKIDTTYKINFCNKIKNSINEK